MEKHFLKFTEKKYTQILKNIVTGNFPFYLIFVQEFSVFECLAFRKFDNFRVVQKLLKEIFVPIAPASKVPAFLIDCDTPGFRRHPTLISVDFISPLSL